MNYVIFFINVVYTEITWQFIFKILNKEMNVFNVGS